MPDTDSIRRFIAGASGFSAGALLSLGVSGPALSSSVVDGRVSVFMPPEGVEEHCVALARVPGSTNLDSDHREDAATDRRLMALDRDFSQQGALWSYTRATFGLSEVEFRQGVSNAREAAAILRASCRAGRLRLDLDPEAYLRDGVDRELTVDCDNPGL